jgi:hypothetical protein
MLRHLALVSETARTTPSDLAAVAAAVQKQIVRDFEPIWSESATMQAFPHLEDVPSDYSPIILRDDIHEPGLTGVHRGPANQPLALVQFDSDWSVTVSHEALELLVDPTLDRVVAGNSLKPHQGRVNYLVEVCDPCRGATYDVNGVRVADFCTPQYYEPVAVAGVRYTFGGTLTAPRQVRGNGYLSWVVPDTHEWWMGFVFKREMQFLPIPAPMAGMSVREAVDRASSRMLSREKTKKAQPVVASAVRHAAASRATAIRAYVDGVVRAAPPRTRRARR